MFRKLDATLRRVLIGVGVLALFIVLFGFSRRIADYTRLTEQLEREQGYMDQLVATQQHLLDRIAYATSEAAVEQWAREQARWARPGDFPVIPLPPAGFTPEPPVSQAEFNTAASNFEIWWNWFFYRGP